MYLATLFEGEIMEENNMPELCKRSFKKHAYRLVKTNHP